MKKGLLLVLFFSGVHLVNSQDTEKSRKGLQYSFYASLGSSTFKTSIAAPKKFPSLESKVGITFEKEVTKNMDIKFRFLMGSKFRRESYNSSNGGYSVGPPYIFLDNVSSGRNHYFIEAPLLFVAKISNPKLNVFLGPNYRFYFPNNDDVDMLTNRGEAGLMAGLSIPITKRLMLGIEAYTGLSKLYTSVVTIDGTEYDFDVRSQFWAFNIEYRIGKTR